MRGVPNGSFIPFDRNIANNVDFYMGTQPEHKERLHLTQLPHVHVSKMCFATSHCYSIVSMENTRLQNMHDCVILANKYA